MAISLCLSHRIFLSAVGTEAGQIEGYEAISGLAGDHIVSTDIENCTTSDTEN
jgi:hypothetical protein